MNSVYPHRNWKRKRWNKRKRKVRSLTWQKIYIATCSRQWIMENETQWDMRYLYLVDRNLWSFLLKSGLKGTVLSERVIRHLRSEHTRIKIREQKIGLRLLIKVSCNKTEDTISTRKHNNFKKTCGVIGQQKIYFIYWHCSSTFKISTPHHHHHVIQFTKNPPFSSSFQNKNMSNTEI